MKRNSNYGIGALITIIISIGSAAILYGSRVILFDPFNLPAWVLGPLGLYTLIFALRNAEIFYYLGWSIIFLAIAFVSATYMAVNVFVVIGVLMIILATIALVAYVRRRKIN